MKNNNDLIENVNFNSTKDTYIYLTKSAYGQYKVGNTINTDRRTPELNVGTYYDHILLCKIEVKGYKEEIHCSINQIKKRMS